MDDYNKGILYLNLTQKESEEPPHGDSRAQVFSPYTDILENERGLMIMIELPGIEPGSISLTVSGTRISVSGYKEKEKSPEGSVLLCIERRFGRFKKDFEIVGAFNTHGVMAKMNGGVLKIFVPRCAELRGQKKRIEIETDE